MGEFWPRGCFSGHAANTGFFLCAVIRPTEEEKLLVRGKTSGALERIRVRVRATIGTGSFLCTRDFEFPKNKTDLSARRSRGISRRSARRSKCAASDRKRPILDVVKLPKRPLGFRALPTAWAIGLHSFSRAPKNLICRAIVCIFFSAPKKRLCFTLFSRKTRCQIYVPTN